MPPKRELHLEEIYKLGATKVQQELFFGIFVGSHRISENFWDEDLFFGLLLRVREKSQE